ncbi:OprO/OprP family phosphate-selective porin [Phenylobacterium sp. LH3H17]|uniref:OprO/OprP family phosphate-selective porin n=1 Tax=Phenylobacterium sp. LH3H17 TaxID=2903901 RepID=UPI0020C9F8D6|nr:porin [Phenylobacterium sp. LH3H17]UTP39121.1 OprO/OprP family phosphate-selective porin [Phenylobacterium sp. LH3H17]
MAWKTKLIAGVAAAAFAWPAMAAADEATDARIKALEEQLSLLQGQIADLKQSTANNIAAVRADATTTTVSLANGRPTIATSDGRFTASFRGVFQLDTAHYDQRAAGPLGSDFRRGSFGDAAENDRARDLNDGANFRRARLGIEGKAFGDFEYNFLYDFGGSGNEEAGKISAAWVQYGGLPFANAKIRIGAFSPPSGLEEAVSTNGSLFAERASPSELVRGIAAGDGRTAAAFLASGDNWTATAAITGNIIGVQTFDEQTAFVGRLSFVPFRRDDSLIHLGVNTSIVINPAASGPDVAGTAVTAIRLRDRPEIRVDGTRLVDIGNIDADGLTAIGAEFGAQWKNFYVQSEYFDIDVDRKGALGDPDFSGWYAQAGWTITGEARRYSNATFDAPRPAKPFDLKTGDWGAWELGLRYSKLDLNYLAGAPGTAAVAGAIRGGEQEIFTLGLNWYVNNVLRFQAAYQDVSVDRLSPGGTAFTAGSTPPAGAQVGQDLKIYSLRTQYAF